MRIRISRRNFLGAATGAAAAVLSLGPIGRETFAYPLKRDLDCAVLDLDSCCALRESWHGYHAALNDQHPRLTQADLSSLGRSLVVIVPGMGMLEPATARNLSRLLETGTTLLLESGAGFLGPSEFAVHQKMLHQYFGVSIDAPVDLWPEDFPGDSPATRRAARFSRNSRGRQKSVPYIDYFWPREESVRDFRYLTPVSARRGEIVGRFGALPVALRRKTGDGTLIFLGSPLGPALHAGDREARSWLASVLASARESL